jgi:trehalose 6-phosphate synthase
MHTLTIPSAWWGESFVNELRRISQTADRKVRFNTPKTESAPADEEDNVPVGDKESDPATALES